MPDIANKHIEITYIQKEEKMALVMNNKILPWTKYSHSTDNPIKRTHNCDLHQSSYYVLQSAEKHGCTRPDNIDKGIHGRNTLT